MIDVLNTAFKEQHEISESMRELEARMSTLGGNELEYAIRQYGNLQQLFEHARGYETEEKYSRVCTGLKMDDGFLKRVFSSLSGGEKTTVMLGRILLQEPDILLLDEPTNHLDMESMEWLEEFLLCYKGTTLIISHDRYFINALCSRIVELRDKKLTGYAGNYEYFRKKRNEEKAEIVNHEVKNEAGIKAARVKPAQDEDKRREAEIIALETEMESIEESIRSIDGEMEVCGSDLGRLSRLYTQKTELQIKLDNLMERWMNLN